MELIARFILMLTANLAAVLLTSYFVTEFQITANVQSLVPLVVSLTIINLLIRPIIKLFLSPLIFLTFGFFTIVINAGILYFIDIFSESLTINGLIPLLYATSAISLINIIIHYSALFFYRRPELN